MRGKSVGGRARAVVAVPSGGHNRKTAKELAAAASRETDHLLNADNPGRAHLEGLLDAWLMVAREAVAEIQAETSVTIVNAGDQVQKHPAVTVLEAASKRIETLVVMTDRFAEAGEDAPSAGEVPEPPKFKVVE